MFVMDTMLFHLTMILTLKNKFIWYSLTLVLSLSFFLMKNTTHAQESLVMSVSPTQFKMSADPGQTWSSSIRVINGNQTDLPVYVSVALFTADGETGQPRFVTPQSDTSTLADWITVTSEPIVIPAERPIQIPFTITVPRDAPPGGQYAALFVGTQPPTIRPDATSVQTSQVIASLIFLQVSGDIVERGLIREFRTNQQIFNRPEASFVLRFENQGTVHLQPQGDITILNMWGEERGLVPINQRTFLGDVLPGQVRRFTFDWQSEWSLTDMGLYTAIATVGYGTKDKQFTTTRATFWVIPWKILLWLGGGLLLFFWFVSWAVRLYIRRMLALAGLPTTSQTAVASVRITPSVMAPLEAGLLDLRDRLQESQSNTLGWWRQVRVILSFVYHYRTFFIVIFIIVVVVIAVIWYIVATTSVTREYEVRVTERDIPVSFSNGQIQSGETVIKDTVTVQIYAAGGSPAALEEVRERLISNGYDVRLESELEGDTRTASVILHSPGYQQEALAISDALGGTLISQYEVTDDQPAGILVQVGSDIPVGGL